jgi:molecular chaperone HtpG
VTSKDGLDPQLERMMKMMNKDGAAAPASKKVLEINMEHPLIKNLSRMYLGDTNNPIIRTCIIQLYEGALFADGELPPTTDFLKRMTEIMEQATK